MRNNQVYTVTDVITEQTGWSGVSEQDLQLTQGVDQPDLAINSYLDGDRVILRQVYTFSRIEVLVGSFPPPPLPFEAQCLIGYIAPSSVAPFPIGSRYQPEYIQYIGTDIAKYYNKFIVAHEPFTPILVKRDQSLAVGIMVTALPYDSSMYSGGSVRVTGTLTTQFRYVNSDGVPPNRIYQG